MNVFLSWSGKKSREIAIAFHNWLPYVIQAAKPFISSGDIDKGKRWNDVLAERLSTVSYGIICITRENYKEPWINFEAGAISKAIDTSYVSPFLFDIDPALIQGPLQQFQITVNDKDDIFDLIRSINNRLEPEQQVTYDVLKGEFDTWWHKLQKDLKDIAEKPDAETQTGFDWLYTLDDLGRIQAQEGCRCIWFITPDPFRNALNPNIKNVIRNNIERDVSYTFIIPSSGHQNVATQGLKHLQDLKPDKVRINDKTAAEDFLKVAVTDYVLMNAESDELEVLVELPSSNGYWLKVDDKAAMGFFMRFRELAAAAIAGDIIVA
jgi:hypothetical protein